MMTPRFSFQRIALIAAAFLVSFAGPSNAAQNCAPRDMVLDRLAEKYGESRQSIGLGANNSVVEVFASAQTGTWSITVTTVRGLTCLVASGEAFETMAETLPMQGNDA